MRAAEGIWEHVWTCVRRGCAKNHAPPPCDSPSPSPSPSRLRTSVGVHILRNAVHHGLHVGPQQRVVHPPTRSSHTATSEAHTPGARFTARIGRGGGGGGEEEGMRSAGSGRSHPPDKARTSPKDFQRKGNRTRKGAPPPRASPQPLGRGGCKHPSRAPHFSALPAPMR